MHQPSGIRRRTSQLIQPIWPTNIRSSTEPVVNDKATGWRKHYDHGRGSPSTTARDITTDTTLSQPPAIEQPVGIGAITEIENTSMLYGAESFTLVTELDEHNLYRALDPDTNLLLPNQEFAFLARQWP